jgi:hypothetical protein
MGDVADNLTYDAVFKIVVPEMIYVTAFRSGASWYYHVYSDGLAIMGGRCQSAGQSTAAGLDHWRTQHGQRPCPTSRLDCRLLDAAEVLRAAAAGPLDTPADQLGVRSMAAEVHTQAVDYAAMTERRIRLLEDIASRAMDELQRIGEDLLADGPTHVASNLLAEWMRYTDG